MRPMHKKIVLTIDKCSLDSNNCSPNTKTNGCAMSVPFCIALLFFSQLSLCIAVSLTSRRAFPLHSTSLSPSLSSSYPSFSHVLSIEVTVGSKRSYFAVELNVQHWLWRRASTLSSKGLHHFLRCFRVLVVEKPLFKWQTDSSSNEPKSCCLLSYSSHCTPDYCADVTPIFGRKQYRMCPHRRTNHSVYFTHNSVPELTRVLTHSRVTMFQNGKVS